MVNLISTVICECESELGFCSVEEAGECQGYNAPPGCCQSHQELLETFDHLKKGSSVLMHKHPRNEYMKKKYELSVH